MINRSRYKKLMAMTPGAQWWEKRQIASAYGYYLYDNDPAEQRKILDLIEWAIKRHKEQDQREETKNRPVKPHSTATHQRQERSNP